MSQSKDEKVEDALKFIEEQLEIYSEDEIATVNSFGKDSILTQWLVRKVNPKIRTLWIKPPFLPDATIDFARKVTQMWNLHLIVVTSDKEKDREFMENVVYKPKLWKTNPELCCQIFKVEPIMKTVNELGLKAWFSGMRKTESEKRSIYTRIWKQGDFTKLHPILNFTEADVWRITAANHLPVHPWYAKGYRSLGCEPCSFPNVWNSERGGRWKDTLMEGGDMSLVNPAHSYVESIALLLPPIYA